MLRRVRRSFSLYAIALFCLLVSRAHAQFGTNLIVNGDAEAGAGSAGGYDIVRPIPGWTPTGNFTVVKYGASGGFLDNASPGPVSRGVNHFTGGPSNVLSSATQTIDVSAAATAIDTGAVTYDLSGWLGGYASQTDDAVLTATFLSASSATLASAQIGPVTAVERGSLTKLLLRSVTGTLPAGTRQISLLLQMARGSGSYNDGYADNLSLILNADLTTVRGRIELQGAVNQAQTVVCEFRPTDGSQMFQRTVTLNADGTYILAGIPWKNYNMGIKGMKWLRKNILVDTRQGDVANANATLRAGDANNDNFADINDLLLLIAHYNQTSPNAGYSDAADFNCDGMDDIADLLLLIGNYNKQGDS